MNTALAIIWFLCGVVAIGATESGVHPVANGDLFVCTCFICMSIWGRQHKEGE